MLAIAIVFGVSAYVGDAAYAAWSANTEAGATAGAKAQVMPVGSTPVVVVTGSSVSLSWPAATLSSGAAVDAYVVRRYDGFNVERSIAGNCAGTITARTCTDVNVANGTWFYTVQPVLANWHGAESVKAQAIVSATPPAVVVNTPTSGSFYRASSWNAACAQSICGTSSSATGVAKVRLSICDASGKYWNGTSFSSNDELLLTASGTTSWSLGFAAANFSSDGAVTVNVVATDIAGNETTKTTTFIYDNTAPTSAVLSTLPAYIRTGYALTASGSDATSGVVSATYFYCAGASCTPSTLIGLSGTSPYSVGWNNASLADGTYKVLVRLTDGAGNTRDSASQTVVIDNSAPTTNDNTTSIGNGWKNASQTVTLTSVDGAGSGVAATYYTIDGSTPTTTSTSGTSVALTADGTYTVKYFSVDNKGNVEAVKTASVQVRIDKTAPLTATMTSLPSAVRNAQVLSASGTDAGSGIASVSYYFCAGTNCVPTTLIGSSSVVPNFSTSWTSQPADGSYQLLARVFDAAGNSRDSAKQTVVVDNTAPVAPSKPALASASDSGTVGDGLTKVSTPTFTGTAEAGATVAIFDGSVQIGSGIATGGAYSITTSPLSDGLHSITAKATDVAGNAGPASTAFAVTIDTAAPTVTVTISNNGGSGKIRVNGTADQFTNAKVTIWLCTSSPCSSANDVYTSTVTVSSGAWSDLSTSLSSGLYYTRVEEVDLAGTVGVATDGPLSH
jgi:hypothetical protein